MDLSNPVEVTKHKNEARKYNLGATITKKRKYFRADGEDGWVKNKNLGHMHSYYRLVVAPIYCARKGNYSPIFLSV
jgi:hypothetical protein